MSHESEHPPKKDVGDNIIQFPGYFFGHSIPNPHIIRDSLPPLEATNVNFDVLYEMGNVAVEPVPESQRSKYRYWRGASLAKIAINLARGIPHLNAGPDKVVHFTDVYMYAVNTAKDLGRVTQLNAADRAELHELTGRPADSHFPGIAMALDEKLNDTYMPPSDYGAQHGYVLRTYLTMEMIDPYSRAAIEELLVK